jgi:hypothetical protein
VLDPEDSVVETLFITHRGQARSSALERFMEVVAGAREQSGKRTARARRE